MFFINGQFWQEDRVPAVRQGPDGPAVMLVPHELQVLFHGFLGDAGTQPFSPEGTDGYIVDKFGNSTITEFRHKGGKLSFKKQYVHREDKIAYHFEKNADGVYSGRWKMTYRKMTSEGGAKCILTPIPTGFLDKPVITSL